MFAIRARRKTVTEKDFLDAVNKVTFPGCVLVSQCRTLTVLGLPSPSEIPAFAWPNPQFVRQHQ